MKSWMIDGGSGELALKDVTQQKNTLLSRVTMMRPENVDSDLLDELARKNLNYGKLNDIVVNWP